MTTVYGWPESRVGEPLPPLFDWALLNEAEAERARAKRERRTCAYMGFTPDTPADEATDAFREAHGCKPDGQIRTGGAVLVGPIPEAQP